jgi:glutaminyl-peptide cyclotransferase
MAGSTRSCMACRRGGIGRAGAGCEVRGARCEVRGAEVRVRGAEVVGPNFSSADRAICKVQSAGLVAAFALVLSAAYAREPADETRPPSYGYRVVKAYPHDPEAYTQGLAYRDGFLYESTGRNGQSTLRKVNLETGAVVQQTRLDSRYFAEGLADWNGHLVQLTWQSGIAFVYDRATFRLENTFTYSGEGWGLTQDGARLIMSDGSDTLRLLDPSSFRERARVAVRDGGMPVRNLNELEFVEGEVYANIWHTDRIARISPQSGRVVGWIDLTGLLPSVYKLEAEAVLNGIAYDAADDRLFVTGKLWPKLFEIRVERRAQE